jgi:hypothetical protein
MIMFKVWIARVLIPTMLCLMCYLIGIDPFLSFFCWVSSGIIAFVLVLGIPKRGQWTDAHLEALGIMAGIGIFSLVICASRSFFKDVYGQDEEEQRRLLVEIN